MHLSLPRRSVIFLTVIPPSERTHGQLRQHLDKPYYYSERIGSTFPRAPPRTYAPSSRHRTCDTVGLTSTTVKKETKLSHDTFYKPTDLIVQFAL